MMLITNLPMAEGQSLVYLRFVVVLILQFELHIHQSLGQQQYHGNSSDPRYNCNDPQKSCQSYVTYRSRPPYDSPLAIADLLACPASDIASANQVQNESYRFLPETLVVVPLPCSCWGNTYLYRAPYTVQSDDNYYMIASYKFQFLTSRQRIAGTNNLYVNSTDSKSSGSDILDPVGRVLVPVSCACPSSAQEANKVSSLLVYVVTSDDALDSIAQRFDVSLDAMSNVNNLTDGRVDPNTPLLVPMQEKSCLNSQRKFSCCLDGQRNFSCCLDRERKYSCIPPVAVSRLTPPPAPPVKLVTILGLSIGIGFVCLFFVFYFLYRHIKKRRHRINKQNLFIKNGGLLLQKRLASSRSTDNLKLFTAEELERATDNYSKSRFLGHGGYGNVYKGMLLDGTIVAVKRSKTMDKTRIEQFVNEVVILSQINHRNVVKLLGSCLETELPLLVYEFIPKGSLSDHIHVSGPESSYLSWSLRFRIACEVAGAVAYMHSAASIPIFHRDIKSSNILLDDKYNAKVSDFGTSRSVPFDKTHLTTAVQGTFGYLDPEYIQSGQFTDKSDVYSFGVVLVELLTGQKPNSGDDNGNVVSRFVSLVNEEGLEEILDPLIAGQVSKREVVVIGKLAKRCLKLHGRKRPSMKEVAMGLENLKKSQTCLDICQNHEVLSVYDSEDENDEMKLTYGDESFTNISLDMNSISPRD